MGKVYFISHTTTNLYFINNCNTYVFQGLSQYMATSAKVDNRKEIIHGLFRVALALVIKNNKAIFLSFSSELKLRWPQSELN